MRVRLGAVVAVAGARGEPRGAACVRLQPRPRRLAHPVLRPRPRPPRLPHDLRPRPAGSGSGSGTTRSGFTTRCTAPTRPTTTACSTSPRKTSSCGSSAGRCGTGWRGFRRSRYVAQYERDNRSVWVQELELPPSAKAQLQAFLRWNAEPEHRFYHYDYYRDNCSTRVRDALDRVAERRAARARPTRVPAGTTYRFHTQRLTANDPLDLHRPAARARAKGSIGRFRPGRRCSCRSRCGSTCGA